ncbi:MAG: DNA-directed DNA polymerase II small subunit [Thermoproteota archaeon]|nr:DNA-directed DNA polymerase II small subunit [Thermoproteota archaeon]
MTVNNNISKIISLITSKGFQIHPDALVLLENLREDMLQTIEDLLKQKKKKKEKSMVILSHDIQSFIESPYRTLDEKQVKGSLNGINKEKDLTLHTMDSNIFLSEHKYIYKDTYGKDGGNFRVIHDSNDKINSGEGVEGFSSLFTSRYEKCLKILSSRSDSKRIKKIGLIKQIFNQTKINSNSTDKEYSENSLFIAGLVMEKNIKKNSYDVTIDDQTGLLTASAYNDELKRQVSMLTLDQMIMIELENNQKNRKFTIKNLYSLDIPDRIPSRSNSEVYSVLISDLHIGSKFFMEQQFNNFLDWLNGTNGYGKDIVSKIKYICICGDLIDGIGIFPNQDKELLEKDAYSQMNHAIEILSKIPKHMKIFLIPGNHDLGRRALPQPSIPQKYASKLYTLENVTMLGNPCMIDMEGIKTLMFHGQSLDDVIATIPGLSYSKPAEAMKILLKARHLSPIYGQRTPIAPEAEDMMVIEEVPDILHSGHVHVIDVDSYKGTLLVNSGAWQTQTPFQQTMGITPTPGIAIVINLSTLKPYQISFNN